LKKLTAYLIVLFWVAMAAWFVRREIIPRAFAPPVRGYAAVRSYAQGHPGYRMSITTIGNKRVGTAKTTYQLRENGDCEIESTASIEFDALLREPWAGKPDSARRWSSLRMTSRTTVGPDDALRWLTVECRSGEMLAYMKGEVKGDTLETVVRIAGTEHKMSIPVTRGDTISTGMLALGALPDLRVGQTWRIRVLAVPTFQFGDAFVTVKRKTTITLRGHEYSVFEVETRHEMGRVTTWVDESGNVLREQAFNLVFTREPLPHELTGRPGEELATPPEKPEDDTTR